MKKWISLLAAALLLVSVIASGLAETADETADLLVVGAAPLACPRLSAPLRTGRKRLSSLKKPERPAAT